MSDEDSVIRQIAECHERRTLALTQTLRVIAELKNTVFFQHVCSMAIPMLYAEWEGFIKEVLQLYLEYLQKRAIPQKDIRSEILAYAWSGSFRKLSSELTLSKKVELIKRFLDSLDKGLNFEKKELEIETKSNLRFKVLEDIAENLCLDISTIKEHEKKLDALVNRRNNIAHGGREQKISEEYIEENKSLIELIMDALESVLLDAIKSKKYLINSIDGVLLTDKHETGLTQ
ncbi:MAG: MAE_28990/MAE_18760 family HEPN-like nuclease [Nitrospirota bacterium]|nr:MAE_28990/MAE_18760 family HEPN-like nuclease [Nitrospirota bacterium]